MTNLVVVVIVIENQPVTTLVDGSTNSAELLAKLTSAKAESVTYISQNDDEKHLCKWDTCEAPARQQLAKIFQEVLALFGIKVK